MSITEIIEPIKLLSGSHPNTGETGQGCFMNVIAYLNGEAQITDESACVCYVVRPIAIWLNDYMNDSERPTLIPYISRAMGSRTDDKDEISRRAWLAVAMAEKMRDFVYNYAGNSSYFADSAADSARYAMLNNKYIQSNYAALSAACAANCASECSKFTGVKRKEISAYALEFMDSALPKTIKHQADVIQRAEKFVSLTV